MTPFLSIQKALGTAFIALFGVVPYRRPKIYTRPELSANEALRQDWVKVGQDMKKAIDCYGTHQR